MDLHSKAAIVTGAGAGIGQAIALRLAREGVAVLVADIDGQAGLSTVRLIEDADGSASFVGTDVAIASDVQRMVGTAQELYGAVDILVNNVGIAPEPFFPNADLQHWDRVLDVNLRGTMLCIQHALSSMSGSNGGAVVNISSMAGVGFQPYRPVEYGATKAAIIRLTTALGFLHDEIGVRVNCIAPGWVETPVIKEYLANMTPAERERSGAPTVLIQPAQIAELVVMLVRDETLAGRVAIWPDEETWRLIPVDAEY